MSAIFERWPRGRAVYLGRVQEVWIDPDPDHQVKVSKARARRMRIALGLPPDAKSSRRRVPSGIWVPICLDGPGHVMVPKSALRPYKGPRYEAPRRVLEKGSTATGRST